MLAVDIRWLIEDRVILGEFCGEGDLNRCHHTLSSIKDLLDESTRPVQIVLNMSQVTIPFRDPHQMFMAARHFRQHPHMGHVIIVTQNTAIRLSGRILAQYLGAPFDAVNTMRHGLVLLQRFDPSLKFSPHAAVA